MIARRYAVYGRVQGVFFRASCREQALKLGLDGSACNRPDGSVEVCIAGAESAVAALERWLAVGPALARVDRVESLACPERPAPGFITG